MFCRQKTDFAPLERSIFFGNLSINISPLCGEKTAVIRISFIGISVWTTKYHAKT